MTLGTGTDIIQVKRIADAIERYGDRFVRRIFTALEIEYCSARKTAALHYAGRFAAKESAFKAMQHGWGDVKWTDVEIYNEPSGAPKLNFYGKAAEIVKSLNVTRSYVSISHIEEYATAIVILE
ncbi:MAG TPA: holo-ACP synthase [Acidobacteriota bacterium]